MGISSLLSCWDTIFFEGFHFIFLFWGGLLADYKMEAQLIIPPVIGGLPCHCWPSIPCSPASEFHWCWISKALSKSPRYKEKKTSKLYNVGWKLHHSSMCMSIPHLKNWWISFQPGKSTGLMTFPSFACPEFHEARRRRPGWFPNDEDQISPWLVGWLNHPIWNILIRQNGRESSPS